MASFHVTSSEAALQLGEDDQHFAPTLLHKQEGLLHKVWTFRSDKNIETLSLTLPGVVFIDFNPNLSSSSAPAPPPTAAGSESETPNERDTQAAIISRVVAKVVVTSDSVEVLEGLELVPLDVDKEDEGFKFRVKNEDAELMGSILTQVFVSDKNQLREFGGSTAEYVLGDAVLVQDDPAADVKVWVFNSASMYLSSKEGFTLRSFTAMAEGTGIYQLQAPSINLQEHLVAGNWGKCTLAIVADTISAKAIRLLVFWMNGDIIVRSTNVRANSICSSVNHGGYINLNSCGAVRKQTVMIGAGGEINTGGIVSEKTDVFILWSGHAVVSAVKELDATALFFGNVEYTNAKPEVVTDSSWLWWKRAVAPSTIVTPAATESDESPAKPYEFREPPLRQPVPIHHRVKMSKRDGPTLLKPDATSWTSRYFKLALTTGVVAVGAIVVIVSRRKAARLA